MNRTLAVIAKHLMLGAGAIFLLYEVGTAAVAGSAHLRGDEVLALNLRPGVVTAAAAQTALKNGKLAEATQLAREALRVSPLDQDALATLALARAQQGDNAAADRLMQEAARGGWRNPAVQIWMIEAALLHRNGAVAVLRADALLRQGHFSGQMIELLRRLAADSSANGTIASRLAEGPSWRRGFLTSLGTLTPTDYEAHERLLGQLKAAGSNLEPEESNAYLSLLIERNEPERALQVWRRIGRRRADRDLLEDSKVRYPLDAAETPAPFSWVTSSTPGLSVTPSNDTSVGGVDLSFDGAGGAKALEQTLVLPPGSYRLQMRWISQNLGTGPSLRWRLDCVGGSELLDQARTRRLANGLMLTAGTVNVPREGCRAQRLEIWLDNDRPDATSVTLVSVSLRPAQ